MTVTVTSGEVTPQNSHTAISRFLLAAGAADIGVLLWTALATVRSIGALVEARKWSAVNSCGRSLLLNLVTVVSAIAFCGEARALPFCLSFVSFARPPSVSCGCGGSHRTRRR